MTRPAMPPAPQPEARVLIVDDEEQIRRLVRILVMRVQNKYALSINEAASVEQAAPLLERQTFHLIISDHNMPGKTGVDLLQSAWRRSPNTARMLITALTQMDIGVEAVNRGHVDAFLRKPWDNASFVALVDSLLEPRVGAIPGPGAPAAVPATARPEAARPRPTTTAAAPPPSAAAAPSRAEMETQLRELERQMAHLRVRLGLGNISAEGYREMNKELSSKRATLERELLQLR